MYNISRLYINPVLFHVSPVAGNPTLTSLEQISSTAVKVMWSPSSGGATVTGYVVHNRTNSSVGTKSSSSTSIDITGLTSGATYTISVEATSQHLSGESEEMTIELSELSFKYYGFPISFSNIFLCTCTHCLLSSMYTFLESWVSQECVR